MIKKSLITLIAAISICNGANAAATDKDFEALTIDLLDSSMKVSQLAVNFNVILSQTTAFDGFLKAIFSSSNLEWVFDNLQD